MLPFFIQDGRTTTVSRDVEQVTWWGHNYHSIVIVALCAEQVFGEDEITGNPYFTYLY